MTRSFSPGFKSARVQGHIHELSAKQPRVAKIREEKREVQLFAQLGDPLCLCAFSGCILVGLGRRPVSYGFECIRISHSERVLLPIVESAPKGYEFGVR